MKLHWDDIQSACPAPIEVEPSELSQNLYKKYDGVILLDDDPTGNQTVHDQLLLKCDDRLITKAIEKGEKAFFVLTNSRSKPQAQVSKLYNHLAQVIAMACGKFHKNYLIVLRSDSTLRGHFRSEMEAYISSSDYSAFVPAFIEGGRITYHGTHYICSKGNCLSADESSYAQDPNFGFSSANLEEYCQEKWPELKTHHYGIHDIRSPNFFVDSGKENFLYTFDALEYDDLRRIGLALLSSPTRPLIRCAASLVSVLLNSYPKYLNSADLFTENSPKGGLVLVGSYVSNSTRQLQATDTQPDRLFLELQIEALVGKDLDYLKASKEQIYQSLAEGKDCIVFTERKQYDVNEETFLSVGQKIMESLVSIVRDIPEQPRFIIAKGGITSHQVAFDGLEINHALVRGQIEPGIPIWELPYSHRFAGMPYIVFPGNVGQADTLNILINKLSAS